MLISQPYNLGNTSESPGELANHTLILLQCRVSRKDSIMFGESEREEERKKGEREKKDRRKGRRKKGREREGRREPEGWSAVGKGQGRPWSGGA